MTRDDVVAEAKSWIKTRWLHQASVKRVGCDCIGLVSGVALALGVPEALKWSRDPRRLSYGREPLPEILKAALLEYLDKKTFPLLPGDVIEMIPPRATLPMHFGIASSPTTMIHAYAPARKVVEHSIDKEWLSRIVGVYCFRGL